MKDELPSMAVRRHLRDALVLGWTGYCAALLAAVNTGRGDLRSPRATSGSESSACWSPLRWASPSWVNCFIA